MNIIEFYTSVLGSVGARDVDGEGLLSAHYAGEDSTITVGGKRLCLPIGPILREGKWDSLVAFHPLCEKINRTESPVLKLLKDVIGIRIDSVEKTLLKSLMHTAVSPGHHKGIGGPKAAAYLRLLPDVTEKTYKILCKILAQFSKPEYRLVNFYLKFGGDLELNASRTCVVSFPIYDDLDDEETKTVLGVACDLKEKKKIKALFDYVFGDAEKRATYSYGSNNPEAPFFHALLTSFYKVADNSNRMVEIHAKRLREDVEDYSSMTIDLEWVSELDSFSKFRGMVPNLEGNTGGAEPVVTTPVSAEARAFNRPGPVEPELKPWEESRPATPAARDKKNIQGSSDPLDSFRSSFQGTKEETRGAAWGGRKEQERDNGWSRASRGRDDRDDRSSRGHGRDDRDDRGGRGGRGGGSGRSFL
jgi:hypothetical protein